MTDFRPSQAYRHDLDIRFADGAVPAWARPLVEGRQPNSTAWVVVMARRAGKSWLAQAAERAHAPGGARRIDLRSGEAAVRRAGLGCLVGRRTAPAAAPGTVLFVDEPALSAADGRGLGVEPAVLAAGLEQARAAGIVPVVLATPAEHELLVPYLGADHPKDVVRPPALTPEECARMAGRAPGWAPRVTELLRESFPGWLQSPFLLELALHTAESRPDLRADAEALDRAACDAAVQNHAYVEQWFHNGTSVSGRARLRAHRWHRAGVTVADAGEGAGQQRAGAADPAADPVLARHLPDVLRIHHVSDLHHGGSLRSNVDAKDVTEAGRRLACLAGAGSPMDSYLEHLRRLGELGRAPHLLVVTGDLVNRPHDTFGTLALNWLRDAGKKLADHPDLRPDDPRIVLVGGNHDVSWDLSLDPRPAARHEWFARTFAEFPHPDLQEPRHERRRLYVRYPEAGLRIALLGSAESGGEAARDEDRHKLEAAQEEFSHTLDEAQLAALIQDFERIDPGVVSRGVLDRLAPDRGWTTLAALHHPLSPVPSVEIAPYSGVVNAGQAKAALTAAETALVLHGHTHLGFLAAERLLGGARAWTTRIAGAPALGSRETDEHNGYNEVFVAREGDDHTLALRTVRLAGGQWVADPLVAFRPGAPAELPVFELCRDRARP
ncbi:metallophosphoesterase family protein [Streptomyces sp. NPDC102406]|uniref:metallophosphoesterase family protein n=1 Tax=Streptomyces sp. NPDC102406 TaxID=3366171 RepID=UPI0037FCB514